jgi:outer membrane protein OmpA-like peptidoglycan-associated protein
MKCENSTIGGSVSDKRKMDRKMLRCRISPTSRNPLVWICIVIVLAMICIPFQTVESQTIYGQRGSVFTPSADTHPNGNFAIGGYFRSIYYDGRRFDVVPVSLITGVSPALEIGFSFPGISGGALPTRNFESVTQLSLKYRFLGEESDTWRYAVSGEVIRPIFQDGLQVEQSDAFMGMDFIVSRTMTDNWQLSASAGFANSGDDFFNNDFRTGVSSENFISPLFKSISDLRMIIRDDPDQTPSVELYSGLRYYATDYLNVSMIGGVGIAKNDFDWQYMIGLSFSSDIFTGSGLDATDLLPPPLETLETLGKEEAAAPVTPPGAQEQNIPGRPRPFKSDNQTSSIKSDVVSRLFFDYNDMEFNPFESLAFKKIVNIIDEIDDKRQILLIGHTDRVGSSRFNSVLGMTRSLNTGLSVFKNIDIDPTRVYISSHGEYGLLNPVSAQYSDQLNRKVDVISLSAQSSGPVSIASVEKTWNVSSETSVSINPRNKTWSLLSDDEVASTRMAIEAIDSLDSDQVLLIEAELPSDSLTSLVYRKALALWSECATSSSFDPKRIFIHLTRDNIEYSEEVSPLQWPIDVDMQEITTIGSRENIKVKVRLNSSIEDERGLRVVATIENHDELVTSYGEILDLEEALNPRLGNEITLNSNSATFVEFSFPTINNDNREYDINFYDQENNLVKQLPILTGAFKRYWVNRLGEVQSMDRGVTEFKAPLRLVLARSEVLAENK